MVLLKAPVSPRKCPVAMPDALAMVKVGNRECGLTKLTPRSRAAASVGAVSGVTEWGRKPSGTNKIRLRWFCAPAAVICRKITAHTVKRTDFEWSDTTVLLIFLVLMPRKIRSQKDIIVTADTGGIDEDHA